jgi:hypothetical protein
VGTANIMLSTDRLLRVESDGRSGGVHGDIITIRKRLTANERGAMFARMATGHRRRPLGRTQISVPILIGASGCERTAEELTQIQLLLTATALLSAPMKSYDFRFLED